MEDQDRRFDRYGDRGDRKGGKRPMRTAKLKIPSGVTIDYKNVSFLQKYVTERGKLVSRRLSGVSAREQRDLNYAIKRARYLGLLPVGSSKRR